MQAPLARKQTRKLTKGCGSIPFILFVLLLGFSPVFAEVGDTDFLFDLFYDPPEDTVVIEIDIDHRRQFEESDQVIIRKRFSSLAAGSAGWRGWPQHNNLSEGFDARAGAVAEARLSFTARPSPIFSLAGSIYTEVNYDEGEPNWSEVKIDELYADYIWRDRIIFRLGQFPMTWGNGRLFTPGNLMAHSENGLAFRASLPTVLDGLTLVSLANGHEIYVPGPDAEFTQSDLVGAALIERVFGNVHLALGGRFQRHDGLRTLSSIKTVIFRTDIFADFVFLYDNNKNLDFKTVSGFFREWQRLMIYGEYFFNGQIEGNRGHNIGLVIGYRNIFSSPVDAGVEWRHAFADNTGRVFPAITFSPWRHIRVNFGVPILYGDDERRWILEERDEDDRQDIRYHLPDNRGISFLFSIGLTYSF